MLTLNDGRNELWQWDTGRTLTVDAECSQVHFSNKVFGRSIDVDVVDGVAEIPDILLQTDRDLIAWAFVGTPENGYTKISKVFKVNRRNKPSNYVFTPPEQTTLGELVEKIDKAVKSVNGVEPDEKGNVEIEASAGGVKTVNGVEPDENGNVEVQTGVQADFAQFDPEAANYIHNRTHYDKYTELATNEKISTSETYCVVIGKSIFSNLAVNRSGDYYYLGDLPGESNYGFSICYNKTYGLVWEKCEFSGEFEGTVQRDVHVYKVAETVQIPSRFIPMADYNVIGGLKVNRADEGTNFDVLTSTCYLDELGVLHVPAPFLNPVNSLTCESVFNLLHSSGMSAFYTGSGELSEALGIPTGSFPVRITRIGADYSSRPHKALYLCETKDGVSIEFSVVMQTLELASHTVTMPHTEPSVAMFYIYTDDDGNYSLDGATFEDIMVALDSGKLPLLINDNIGYAYNYSGFLGGFCFKNNRLLEPGVEIGETFIITSNSAVLYYQTEIPVRAISAPETAAVGQTLRVAEVDDNGKPTAWEAVDFPSGGGDSVLTVETITIDDSGTEETIAVTGVTLDHSNISLTTGDSMMLAASVLPSNATNKTVLWKSSNTGVATVGNGYVTAISEGDAVITAYSVENNSIAATCSVAVAAAESGAIKVLLSTLDIVDGSCVNKSGTPTAINNQAHYVEIPYYDGMFISATHSSSWKGTYPPFMVVTGGTYTVPDYTMSDKAIDTQPGSGTSYAYQTTTTLTGYAEGATVIVNMCYADITANDSDIAAEDLYYYTYGGES